LTGFDPVRIIEVLAVHEVEFVVIGGFAAELYRAPVQATKDVDITPKVSTANLTKLSAALEELGARIRTSNVPEGLPFSHDASSLARATVWNLTTVAGDFDLSFQPSGTSGYDDLSANAVVLDVDGHRVAVAALADIVRSKEAAGRPKDVSALDALQSRLDTLQGTGATQLRTQLMEALRRRQSGSRP